MTKHSQNLEVVSSSPQPPTSTAERRRLPRLNLTGEQFRLASNGKIFSVTDLSASGMAIRMLEEDDALLFPVATQLTGTLNLAGQKHLVSAQVRRLAPGSVGCEFENLTAESQAALDHFLNPKRLGQELKPIPSSEAGTLWYNGPSGTDLLVKRTDDGVYRRMTLYVHGSYIQWAEDTSLLTTGRVRPSGEQSETRGIMRFETLWLEPDTQLDPGKLAVAKTLILSSNLPEDFKSWCSSKFGS